MEHLAVPMAQDKPADLHEIPIAGRTKMAIPKNMENQDALSSDSDSSDAPAEETTSEKDAKSELNAILKRSPSTFTYPFC